MKNSHLLSTKEVSVKLRTTRGVLANWRSHGEGPQFIRIGKGTGKRGKILYDEEDLEKWILSHKVRTIDTLK